MKLGKKRNASVFQTAPVSAAESGNQSLSAEPELITEMGNTSEPTAERFANLQFGPDVDVLNPPDEQEAAPLRDNRALRAHGLFFTPETEGKDFSSVLTDVQAYISGHYSTLLTEGGEDAKAQMKRYIQKFLQDNRISVGGMSGDRLADALYTEMAEFGFLTKYIFGTGIEEIDINSWKDIEVQYSDGRTVKLEERFESPQHAVNVIRRMLHISGMVLDNASPIVLGHLNCGRGCGRGGLHPYRQPAEYEKRGLCPNRHGDRPHAGLFIPLCPLRHLGLRGGRNIQRQNHRGRLGADHRTGQQENLYH